MSNITLTLKELAKSYLAQEYFSTRSILAILNASTYSKEILNQVKESSDTLSVCESSLPGSVLLLLEFKGDLLDMKGFAYQLKEEVPEIEYLAYVNSIEIGSESYWSKATDNELRGVVPPVILPIQRSKHNIPTIGAGGGSAAGKFEVRYVLNARKQLKHALFIRKNEDLCNSLNMAVIPISVYDIIVEISGVKPLSVTNSDLVIKMRRVITINQTSVETEDISSRFDIVYLPSSVVEGSDIFHNRSGAYFCSGLSNKIASGSKKAKTVNK